MLGNEGGPEKNRGSRGETCSWKIATGCDFHPLCYGVESSVQGVLRGIHQRESRNR